MGARFIVKAWDTVTGPRRRGFCESFSFSDFPGFWKEFEQSNTLPRIEDPLVGGAFNSGHFSIQLQTWYQPPAAPFLSKCPRFTPAFQEHLGKNDSKRQKGQAALTVLAWRLK
jgi:hypothetical protein